jgi:hypothetical protein
VAERDPRLLALETVQIHHPLDVIREVEFDMRAEHSREARAPARDQRREQPDLAAKS